MLEDRLHICNDIIFSCFLPDDWLKEFRMPFHALIQVHSGIMHIEYENRSLWVNAGEFVFLRREHLVRLHKKAHEGKPYSATNICLKPDMLLHYSRKHRIGKQTLKCRKINDAARILSPSEEIAFLFELLQPYADKTQIATSEFLNNQVLTAIRCLLNLDEQFYPTLFDFRDPWKIDLAEFMETHFLTELSIREFALYTGRSLATFKRDFARFSTLPPQRWLIQRRLELAHELLLAKKCSVTEACWRVGFKNRSHFTTAFKRQYGKLPSAV